MKAIAAMAQNRVIGADGKIPWHLPEDLKFFKKTTLGHVILMGRKTWDSLGRPLPGRESWVVSRSASQIPGVRVFHDISDLPETSEGREIYLIGGAQLYEQLLPKCDELYLTLVHREVDGDALFPSFEHLFVKEEVLMTTSEMEVGRYVRRQATGPLRS